MKSSEMSLYDKEIRVLLELLSGLPLRRLPEKSWSCTDRECLVLRSDMAFELGGDGLAAVSGLAFTADREAVPESGVFLAGRDLPELLETVTGSRTDTPDHPGKHRGGIQGSRKGEVPGSFPYARITLLRLKEDLEYDTQGWYGVLKKLGYTRYHVFPEGYMMRISAVKEREPVRVSREALKRGMDFGSVGKAFLDAYLAHSQVEAARVIFLTTTEAPYARLQELAGKFDRITASLDQVFAGLSMDCTTCGQRELCEEIEGLKDLHLRSMRGV